MKHFHLTAAIALAFVVVAAPRGAAQVPPATVVPPTEAQGLFTNWPVGLTITSTSPTRPVLIRASGANTGKPAEWSAAAFGAASPVHPDYSMSMLTTWAPASIDVPIFGGISTGGEILPTVDQNGVMMLSVDQWFALTFTVGGTSQGEAGSMIAARAALGNPGGDVISYYARGSESINPAYPHTVRLEYSRDQLQLQQATPTTSTPREISNFDIGMGVIASDPTNRAGIMFATRDRFYFTLTKAWADAANQLSIALGGAEPDSATIYVMQWNGTSWSAPSVLFDAEDLFGQGAVPEEYEIDALSVGCDTTGACSSPQRVILSLTPESNTSTHTFDQILVRQVSPWPCTTTALKLAPAVANGSPVEFSTVVGLRQNGAVGGPDDVTSTCGIDPPEPYNIGPVLALATDQQKYGDGELGLTAYRQSKPGLPNGNDVLHIEVAGMEYAPYQFGFVQLYTEGEPWGTSGANDDTVEWGDPFVIDAGCSALNRLDLPIEIPNAVKGDLFRFSATVIGVSFTPSFTVQRLRNSAVLGIRL